MGRLNARWQKMMGMILFVSALVPAYGQFKLGWETNVDDGFSLDDTGTLLAVAPDQQVYAGGFSLSNGVKSGLVIKLNSNGEVLWKSNLWGNGVGDLEPGKLAVATNGDVTLAYRSDSNGVYALGLARWTTAGDLLWRREFEERSTNLPVILNAGQDTFGRIYLAVRIMGSNRQESACLYGYGIDGQRIWTKQYSTRPSAAVTDGAGHTFISAVDPGGSPWSCRILAVDSDGNEIWNRLSTLMGTGDGIGLDAQTNVYVLTHGAVMALAPATGSNLWVNTNTVLSSGISYSHLDFQVAPGGEVYWALRFQNGHQKLKYSLVKFAATGVNRQWVIDEGGTKSVALNALGVDIYGNAYLGGTAGTYKLTPEGTQLGRYSKHSSRGESFAMASDGRVYAVGQMSTDTEGANLSIICYLTNPPDDFDGDQLPNDWEAMYFGSPYAADPSEDRNLNGLSNLSDYIAGISPIKSNAFFRCRLSEIDSHRKLVFDSLIGRTYRIEKSSLAEGAEWTPIEVAIVYTNGVYQLSLDGSDDASFYRVFVELNK